MRGFASALVLVVLVSGCAADPGMSGGSIKSGSSTSNAPLAPASTSIEPAPEADPSKGVGAIDGMVTDDELIPLAGVLIQVHPRDTPDQNLVELRSDDLGAFRLDGLMEGPYAMYASKPGYETNPPRVVEIKPEETAEVKVELKKLPSLEPNQATKTFVWQPDYAYAYRIDAASAGGASSGGSGSILVNQSADGDLRTIIVESVWQDSGSCTSNMRTIAYSPDNFAKQPRGEGLANPYYWDNLPNVTKPTHMYIPREGTGREAITSPQRRGMNFGLDLRIDGPWSFQTRLEARDYMGQSTVKFSCAMGIKIETWVTIFYKQDAPSRDWTVFPKT